MCSISEVTDITLKKTEDWFEATRFMFCICRILDSLSYCMMYDCDKGRFLDHQMTRHGYVIVCTRILKTIWNSITGIFITQGTVFSVCFHHVKDEDIITLSPTEGSLF